MMAEYIFQGFWGLGKDIGNTILSQMEHEKLLTRCDPLYKASLSNKHTKILLKTKKTVVAILHTAAHAPRGFLCAAALAVLVLLCRPGWP